MIKNLKWNNVATKWRGIDTFTDSVHEVICTISLGGSRCTSTKFIYKDEVNCHIATFVIRLTIRILFSWPIAMQCNVSFYQMFFYHKKKKCTFILCFENQSQRRIWLANNVIIQWNTVLTSSFFHKGLIICLL